MGCGQLFVRGKFSPIHRTQFCNYPQTLAIVRKCTNTTPKIINSRDTILTKQYTLMSFIPSISSAGLVGVDRIADGVYINLAVCEDKGLRGMVFAPTLVAGSPHQMFSNRVRGLWFHIIVDKNAKPGNKDVCCVRSEKKVLHLEDCESRLLHAGRHLYKTARVSPSVKPKTR